MNWQRITITVDGEEGRLSARSFMKVLRSFVDLLDQVRVEVDGADEGFDGWVIEEMSKRNPGSVTFAAAVKHEVIEYAVEGLRLINEKAAKPKKFPSSALASARTMVSQIGHGISEIHVQNGTVFATPTQHVAANVDAILGEQFYSAPTTIEGRLSVIDVRGKLVISVRSDAYDRDIRCVCPATLFDKAKEYLNRRISIVGEVRYNKKTDEPVSIKAEEIEPLDEIETGFAGLDAIDITDGQSSEDHVRRLRDEQ